MTEGVLLDSDAVSSVIVLVANVLDNIATIVVVIVHSLLTILQG